MKAVWNGKLIAEAPREDLIYIEGSYYFPPSAVKSEFLVKSETPYTCPWKGVCQFFDVVEGDNNSKDSAWSYPEPKSSAIDTVKKDFSNYVAFYRDVKIEE